MFWFVMISEVIFVLGRRIIVLVLSYLVFRVGQVVMSIWNLYWKYVKKIKFVEKDRLRLGRFCCTNRVCWQISDPDFCLSFMLYTKYILWILARRCKLMINYTWQSPKTTIARFSTRNIVCKQTCTYLMLATRYTFLLTKAFLILNILFSIIFVR